MHIRSPMTLKITNGSNAMSNLVTCAHSYAEYTAGVGKLVSLLEPDTTNRTN